MFPRVAIVIDAGFLLKRIDRLELITPYVDYDCDVKAEYENYIESIDKALDELVQGHLNELNEIYHLKNAQAMLHRVFFYDATPYSKGLYHPLQGYIPYHQKPLAKAQDKLHEKIRQKQKYALRLGTTAFRGWKLEKLKAEQSKIKPDDVIEIESSDGQKRQRFRIKPEIHQKGVDMRLGLDIARLVLSEQANIIILVSGDSDFVSAAKLARRAGAEFILDPLWQENIDHRLKEHIDSIFSSIKLKK